MICHILKGSLFQQLPDEVQKCLLSKARIQKFDRGSTICLQGETARTLKIVQSGWIKLYRVSQNGGEAILATLKDGQSFDELASLQGKRSPASAQAVSDCTILHVDPSRFGSCEGAQQELMKVVLAAASEQIEALMDDIEKLKVKTGAERLSEYLVGLARKADGRDELVLPFEKTLLAGKLGMKPESLSRAFGRLKPLGVGVEKRQVTIKNIEMLRSFAEGLECRMISAG